MPASNYSGEVKPTFFATAGELRQWLERNHATATELLVGFYKRRSGKMRSAIPTGLLLASRAAPGARSTSPVRRN